jgi:predicted amidohydrolase
MRIALVQQHATPDKADNIARGLRAFEAAARAGAELVCFAELAFEPFYPQRRAEGAVTALAETVPGPITEAFAAKARELGVVVVLNLFERDDGRTFDCSPVVDADGSLLGRTRMIHITDYACFHEQGYYTPGDLGAPVYRTRAGRIGVAICYDRHYPEYMRALAVGGADLVVVPQAGSVGEWPEGLYEAEMRVAAFQNGYFVALCNRVGVEDQLTFAGDVARPAAVHAAPPAGAVRLVALALIWTLVLPLHRADHRRVVCGDGRHDAVRHRHHHDRAHLVMLAPHLLGRHDRRRGHGRLDADEHRRVADDTLHHRVGFGRAEVQRFQRGVGVERLERGGAGIERRQRHRPRGRRPVEGRRGRIVRGRVRRAGRIGCLGGDLRVQVDRVVGGEDGEREEEHRQARRENPAAHALRSGVRAREIARAVAGRKSQRDATRKTALNI